MVSKILWNINKMLKKMFKQKRAQFYVFTAIVLIAYALLTVQSGSTVETSSNNFKQVYDNYIFESSIALNNALFEQADVSEEYERFMDGFISYSKMKKLKLEIFSILETGDNVHFSNKMNMPVYIININQTLQSNGELSILRSNVSEVVIEVRDDVFHENIYKFSISNQGTDAKAVLKVRKGRNREIFVQE
jgi:hypothetical protein